MDKLLTCTNYIGNRELKFNHNCVVIARKMIDVPYWKHDIALAPTSELMYAYKSGNISFDDFIKEYKNKVLGKLDPNEIARKYNGYNLICYEKDWMTCHRYGYYLWQTEAGIECREDVLFKSYL